MKTYVGTKIIQAQPMKLGEFNKAFKRNVKPSKPSGLDEEGYVVYYPDGYTSWSPKVVFETAYREITHSERSMIE